MTDPLWNDNVVPDLPKWLTDLRDGVDDSRSVGSEVRAQRLAQMERDLADLTDFVTDCDRYSEYMEHLESPCVHNIVPKMMGRHLDALRSRAVSKGCRIREELAILRRQE